MKAGGKRLTATREGPSLKDFKPSTSGMYSTDASGGSLHDDHLDDASYSINISDSTRHSSIVNAYGKAGIGKLGVISTDKGGRSAGRGVVDRSSNEPSSFDGIQSLQEEEIANQDQILDKMSQNLESMQLLGQAISDELDVQGKQIDETVIHVEDTISQVENAKKLIGKVMEEAGGRNKCMIILFLSILLLLLTFIAFS